MSAIDSELRGLGLQTVVVRPKTGRTKYGTATVGTGVSYTARVVEGPVEMQDELGNTMTVQGGVAWIFGAPVIGGEDEIELPSGELAQLEKVERFPDDEGFEHVKISFSVTRRR